MSKIKVPMTYFKYGFRKVFRCGYCDLQYIMREFPPTYYNAGVCGWNCDIYSERGFAITTGYRNMRGACIPSEIIDKYSNLAKDICNKYRFGNYDAMLEELRQNKEKFLDELETL